MMESDPSIELAAMELFEAAMEAAPDDPAGFVANQTDVDAPIKKRALELLAAGKDKQAPLHTGGAASLKEDDEHPEQIGAYRILRLLGKGGMGNVYLGERASDDFDHVVAVKVIKTGLLSDSLIERFRRERQILAQLNHQHIAHLHDGGEMPDGSPYIVMEYVDGIPLSQWLETHNPSLSRRLNLFLQICDAVEFAHQNLIIHRDLTPSNVLISDGDQAKLIDFGIARPHSADDAGGDTSTFSGLSLTPGFAAPERSKGTAANTLFDIFSLGRIMLVLIADEANSELSAIADKAASDDPEDRYASARELSNDVINYLEDIPVTAFSVERRYRFKKFVHRQKVIVGSVATVFLLALAALAIVTLAYRETELARHEAERRFADTHAIANTMMFEVYDEVGKVPRSTQARALLAETALKHLDSLANDDSAPVHVRIDAGLGYIRLGQIIGNDVRGNTLGDLLKGREYFAEAKALLQDLYKQYPDRSDVKAAYGRVLTQSAGQSILVDGDSAAGMVEAGEAVELLNGLDDLNEKAAAAHVLAYRYLADAEVMLRSQRESEASMKKGLAKAKDYLRATPGSLEIMRAEAELRQTYAGFFFYFAQKQKESEAMFENSVALRRKIAKATNNAPDDIYKLLIGIYYLGLTESAMGLDEEAYHHAKEAYELAESERIANVDSRSQNTLLAGMKILYGQILSKRGQHRQAVDLADESIALMRGRHTQSQDIAAIPMNLAVRLHQAANIYSAAGQNFRSCDAMRESVGYMQAFEREKELPIVNRTENLEPMLSALKQCSSR